jgi:hypothetical protein
MRAAGRTLTLDELTTQARTAWSVANLPIRMASGRAITSAEIAGGVLVLDDGAGMPMDADDVRHYLHEFVAQVADGTIELSLVRSEAASLLDSLGMSDDPEAA